MNSLSNRVILLFFTGFQVVIFLFVYYLVNRQNIFYTEMLSLQNLQIKELNENLTRITLLQLEQARLILDLQAQQKILVGVTFSLVLVLGGFFLFFYSPGVSPEVAQNHMSFITDSFISQNNVILEMLNDIEKIKATELFLNAAQGVETASKILS